MDVETRKELQEIRTLVEKLANVQKGVDLEFREIVAVEGGDSFLPRTDGDWPDLYTADSELEKLTRGEPLSLMKHAGVANAGWDEQVSVLLAKSEKRHADGVEIEKHGGQTWHWHWQGGELAKSTVEDVDLPGGVMHFDREGNEIAAA